MMRIIYCFIFIALMVACSKNEDSFGGNETLLGKLYITDSFFNNGREQVLPNTTVYIQSGTAEDTVNYLYSVKTDALGNFVFKNLKISNDYFVYTKPEVTIGGVKLLFFGSAHTQINNYNGPDTVLLKADYRKQGQNGLFLTTLDSLNGRLPNVSVYLYTSRVLASADKDVNGVGSYRQLTSDQNGKLLTLNLPTDSIYINAKGVYGNLNLYARLVALKLSNAGIKDTAIVLK